MSIKVPATTGKIIHIGRAGENLATTVTFDIKEWYDQFGIGGTFTLFVQQNGLGYYLQPLVDDQPSAEDPTVEWLVTNSNTIEPGLGKCELSYVKDEVVVKSVIYDIVVTNSLDMEAAGDVPTPIETWLEYVASLMDVIEGAEGYAEAAEVSANNAYNNANLATAAATRANNDANSAHTNAAAANISAQQSQHYFQTSQHFAEESEAYAKGTKNGVPVTSEETGYHDNAKYYKEQIEHAHAGTTTTLEPGNNATVNVSFEPNGLRFDFGIPRGSNGEQGAGLTITGRVNSVANLPAASSVAVGTAYGVGTTVPYDLYISNGTVWVNFGPLSGMIATLVTWTA